MNGIHVANRNVFMLFSIVFSLYVLSNCATTPLMDVSDHSNDNHLDWFYTNKEEKAISVVIHGLNTKPAKMEYLVNLLTDKGVSVINVTLSGHRGNSDEFKKVTREIWLSEAGAAFDAAKKYIKGKNLPVIFLGFSLGGLVGLDAAVNNDSKVYDYAVLFAPAVTPRWQTHLVTLFYIFGNAFVIPSKAPAAYRANNGTTVAAYKALFNLSKDLIKRTHPEKINVPTICFIDKKDELVDMNELKRFIKKHNLDMWEIIEVKKDRETAREKYYHLIIDPYATGSTTWELIEMEINSFLTDITD